MGILTKNKIKIRLKQVQGVKGNAEKDSGTDVDSIVERIKKGELKLPPSSGSTSTTTKTTTTSTTRAVDPTTFRPTLPPPQVSVSPNSVSTSDKYVTSASSISGHVFNTVSSTAKPHSTGKYSTYSSSYESNDIVSSTTPGQQSSTFFEFSPKPVTSTLPTRAPTTFITPTTPSLPKESLSQLLRREGLFAMAKYLRQSGLDSVLNETGKNLMFFKS